MSKFNSMVLPRNNIVEILAEGEIAAISEQDILRPNPDFVSELYQRILIALGFFDEEEYGQVDFAALEQLENPDLHRDSIKIMKLCKRMKEVMASGLCHENFTLKDLIKPDRVRTEVFISSLLNFYLYKASKMDLLAPIINDIGLLEEQQRDLEDKIVQLNAKIENHHESRERELPLVQEVESKVKELSQTVASLNKQQLSLRKSLKDLKDKSGEMDEKICNAEFALVQSVQENTNLRSKIVQSPDKLQKTLEEKKSVLEDAKSAERLALQSFQEKTTMVEVFTKVFKKMSKHLSQMEAIQAQVSSAKTVDKDLKNLKAKLSEETVLDKSLEAKLVELQRKVQQVEESKFQLEKEMDVKCEEAAKEFERLTLDVESRRQDLEARQKNVEAVVAEVDSITSKTTSVKEAAATKQKELFHKCEEIVREFDSYASSIGSLLPGINFEQRVV